MIIDLRISSFFLVALELARNTLVLVKRGPCLTPAYNPFATARQICLFHSLLETATNAIRKFLFTCPFLVISGCAGIGAIAPADRDAYLNSKTIPRTISLEYNPEQKTRTIHRSYNGAGPDKRYSTEEVRQAWGIPDEIASDGRYTVWTYHEQTLLWSGIALHALVTIPLAIPTGKENYTLYFNNDELEKALHHTFSTKLLVCDPAYMLVGVMAAGMSPTGRGSAPGLCNAIEREGMYFHYLMNY